MGGISCAMALRCGKLLAMSGVGISRLSCGMVSHSVRVGTANSAPPSERTVMPATLRPYFSSFSPLHVDKKYFSTGPSAPRSSASSLVTRELLLCSSTIA